MSEHQYYEFQAVDRPLTQDQRSDLHSEHTRKTTLIDRCRKAKLLG